MMNKYDEYEEANIFMLTIHLVTIHGPTALTKVRYSCVYTKCTRNVRHRLNKVYDVKCKRLNKPLNSESE